MSEFKVGDMVEVVDNKSYVKYFNIGQIVKVIHVYEGITGTPFVDVEVGGRSIAAYASRFKKVNTLPAVFTFTHKNDVPSILYKAEAAGATVTVTWEQGGNVTYPTKFVEKYVADGTWQLVSSPSVEELKKELEAAEENYRNVMDAAIKRVVDARTALRIAKGE